MAQTPNVAVTGKIYFLPLNDNLEIAGIDTEIPEQYEAGFVSEDGLTRSTERETESITVWQNSASVREAVTASSVTWQVNIVSFTKLIEDIYYGGTVDGAGKRLVNPANLSGFKAVIDIVDTNASGGFKQKRFYMPKAEITELGEQVFNSTDPVGCEITFKGLADIDGTAEIMWTEWFEEAEAAE